MRFIENGPQIPEELIKAQLAGKVIFLCGAGVSMFQARLPTFKGLTDYIYRKLGELPQNEASEKIACRRYEYDRALRSLEKRTCLPNSGHSEVRALVEKRLAYKPKMRLDGHKDLLRLSTDSQKRPRILTTNFDTLFERAAASENISFTSHAVKSMPKAGGPHDYGILHLHGRVEDAGLDLPRTDFILTSADFGDAYLRDGWASQYLEDRVRQTPIILIGYSAEDAALRLLIETLDADKVRFPDLKNIYAFCSSRMDDVSIWKAKGIIPIPSSGHDHVYATIHEWAMLSQTPSKYCTSRLKKIFEKSPSQSSEYEKEQVELMAELLDTSLLVELAPSLAWGPYIWKKNDTNEKKDRFLIGWIKKTYKEPDAIRQVVSNIEKLDKKTIEWIFSDIRRQKEEIPKVIYGAWEIISRYAKNRTDAASWLEIEDVKSSISSDNLSITTVKQLVDLLEPKLSISSPYTFGADENAGPLKLNDLMNISFEVTRDTIHEDLISRWPQDSKWTQDNLLLNHMDKALSSSLEEAIHVGKEETDRYSISDANVPSVADHPQNKYHYGFLPLVRSIADIWTRLSAKKPETALLYFEQWQKSEHKICRRLALFAAASSVVSKKVAAELLLKITQNELFISGTTVEVFRLIKARWADFTPTDREKIESRLRRGPHKNAFYKGADAQEIIDRCVFDILGRLETLKLKLSTSSKHKLKRIRKRYPQWKLSPEEQDGFHTWMGTTTEWGDAPQDLTKLDSTPDEQLIDKARELDDKTRFGSGGYWISLCEREPQRALRALKSKAIKNKEWPEKAWARFLAPRTEKFPQETIEEACQLLVTCPARPFKEIAETVVDWMENSNTTLPDDVLWSLWEKIYKTLSKKEYKIEKLSFDTAINHPSGKLVRIILKRMTKDAPLLKEMLSALNRCVATKGNFGILSAIRLAADVSFLYGINAKWTQSKLVPLFRWTNTIALYMWSARKYANHIGHPSLFKMMKKDFLALFTQERMNDDAIRTFAEWLPAILLSNKEYNAGYALTDKEARAALRHAGSRALSNVAHRLAIEMEKTPKQEKAAKWKKIIGPTFKGIWPLDIELQSVGTNFKLLQLLKATGEAFSEAITVIAPYIRSEESSDNMSMYSLKTLDDDYYVAAPEMILQITSVIVGSPKEGKVYDLDKILDKVKIAAPALENKPLFQRLKQYE